MVPRAQSHLSSYVYFESILQVEVPPVKGGILSMGWSTYHMINSDMMAFSPYPVDPEGRGV